MKIHRYLLVYISLLLTACGGGESQDPFYSTQFFPYSWDDSFTSSESYTTTTTEVIKFPLALHYSTISKSPTSKIGTTQSILYSASGKMTTKDVSDGIFEAQVEIQRVWESTTLFEGVSTVPILTKQNYSNVKLNGSGLPSEYSEYRSYYDTNHGIRVGAQSSSTYDVLSNLSKPYPTEVAAGDSGNTLVFYKYPNSSKLTSNGFSISSYQVLSITRSANGDYTARVENTVKNFSAGGLLESLSTTVDDLTWTSDNRAGIKNISILLEDVSGPTTSRINLYRK